MALCRRLYDVQQTRKGLADRLHDIKGMAGADPDKQHLIDKETNTLLLQLQGVVQASGLGGCDGNKAVHASRGTTLSASIILPGLSAGNLLLIHYLPVLCCFESGCNMPIHQLSCLLYCSSLPSMNAAWHSASVWLSQALFCVEPAG